MPVTAYGNISKGGGKYTPRYARFNSGWRLIPYDEDGDITITGEQITDEGTSGKACLDLTTLTHTVFIHYEPPASEIVKDIASLAAIAQMSFNNEVWHDVNEGTTIAEHASLGRDPILLGNGQFPASESEEAFNIAEGKKIKSIRLTGPHVLSESLDLTGYTLRGDSAVNDSLNIESDPNVSRVTFRDLTLSGIMDGGCTVRDCLVNGLTYFNGITHETAFTSTPVLLGGTGTAMFLTCYSAVAGGNDRPTIDFDNQPTNLAVRGWLGGLELINKTTEAGDCSIDMTSGTIYIRSSCTAGEITVRGTGKCVDESGAGCVVLREGLLDPAVSQTATFGGYVHVDLGSCCGGIHFPAGNEQHHVNNLADAKLIAEYYSIKKLRIHSSATIEDIDLSGYTIEGVSAAQTTLNFASSAVLDNTTITNCTATGELDTNAIVRDCVVHALTYLNGFIYNCAFTSAGVVLGGTNPALIMDCYSLPTAGTPTVFNCNGQDTPLIIRGFKGGLVIKNRTTDILSSLVFEGMATIDSSCTAGLYNIAGMGEVNDNTILDIDTSKVVSNSAIAEAVWSKEDAQKLLEENLGHAVISPDNRHVTIRKRSDNSISHEFDISADKKTRSPV